MATPRYSSPWTGSPGARTRALGVHSPSHRPRRKPLAREKEPLWYKDAVIYELHVRAFFDSNGDGIGDFRGLTQKLDYLQELGVSAIWLLPFYPSPLKDDGYDIADYYTINPIYGTLRDFRASLAAAHERNLRVITELVVNHTSDQHPWFQRARRAPPGSAWRDFYVWSEKPEKYKEARIIFRDFEPSNWTWDPIAHAYYWHRFYSHQPDLNYDNPLVHKEIARVLDFWLDLGVDGVRLDAVPYLYEREGTSCENLPETHSYLKGLRRHIDEKYEDRMLLAEANQWPEDAVSYFGSGKGDECHMAFHFPLMPRIFMAVRMEDRVPIVDILQQTPAIPETSQWALFLRNHDELTLEMVTDEERDYMYRVYANDARARINLGIRRRLAPLLGNDRKRIELLNLLLFSLPGTPVLYYGDEIGMGDNVFLGDRNGVRTPMQWSSDKNAGFSRASPHALYLPIILDPEYHYEAINVEAQQRNPNSLFWWMKRALTLRKRYQAFGRGSLQFLKPENRKILAFVRQFDQETILVIANLSRFPQPVRIDLSQFARMVPVELFGHTDFPVITEQPYFLTLSPHAAYWFLLEPGLRREEMAGTRRSRELSLPEHWENLLYGDWRADLESHLLVFLGNRPPGAGPGRELKSVQIRDAVSLPSSNVESFQLVLLLEYPEGDPEEIALPVALARGPETLEIEKHSPEDIIAHLRVEAPLEEAVLYEATQDRRFGASLFETIARRRVFNGAQGEFKGLSQRGLRDGLGENHESQEASIPKTGHSNPAAVFGGRYFLKLFRRLEPGPNPDLELGLFLTEQGFPNVPPVEGWLQYRRHNGEQFTIGILTRFLPEAQDAWAYTLDMLGRYFERVRTAQADASLMSLRPEPWKENGVSVEVPEKVVGLVGTYLELARLLGQRTGEMHHALGSDPLNREFSPEPFTPFYQRSLFQSMRNLAVQTIETLRSHAARVPDSAGDDARLVCTLEPQMLARFRAIAETRMDAGRIRCHGDFHLGQVLYTGKDFVFIDFEGESWRHLGERRIKRSPLRDVASMMRSFDYIATMALHKQLELGALQEADLPRLQPWASFWQSWVSSVYLKAYLEASGPTGLLPQRADQLRVLLEAHLLEKALYEIGYEMSHRPEWVGIPLRGILQLLPPAGAGGTAPA